MAEQHSDYGIYGLTPLGAALALKLAAARQRVALWDANAAMLREFVLAHRDTAGGLAGYSDARDFVASMRAPRTILLAVEATALRPLLAADDRTITPYESSGLGADEMAATLAQMMLDCAAP